MRDDFILQFLNELQETGANLLAIWLHTPYKGFRMSNLCTPKLRQGLRNLRYRGYLLPEKNNTYRFSDKGCNWLHGALLKYHRNLGIPWDGKWRMVIFDIPKDYEQQRHRFRAKLKMLGFQMIQKSIFVIPYPCEQEIARVCKNLKLSEYVDVITAETIGSQEENLKSIFGLG